MQRQHFKGKEGVSVSPCVAPYNAILSTVSEGTIVSALLCVPGTLVMGWMNSIVTSGLKYGQLTKNQLSCVSVPYFRCFVQMFGLVAMRIRLFGSLWGACACRLLLAGTRQKPMQWGCRRLVLALCKERSPFTSAVRRSWYLI